MSPKDAIDLGNRSEEILSRYIDDLNREKTPWVTAPAPQRQYSRRLFHTLGTPVATLKLQAGIIRATGLIAIVAAAVVAFLIRRVAGLHAAAQAGRPRRGRGPGYAGPGRSRLLRDYQFPERR